MFSQERTYAQEILDKLRQKNEENRNQSLLARVNELTEENIRLRKKQEDVYSQSHINQSFANQVKAEELENRNKVLKHQLDM